MNFWTIAAIFALALQAMVLTISINLHATNPTVQPDHAADPTVQQHLAANPSVQPHYQAMVSRLISIPNGHFKLIA